MVDSKKTNRDAANSTNQDSSDFVLKHRVAGAAFLLFFGALVLPWLLGPPSEASKTPIALTVDANDNEISALEIENEILADLEDNSEMEAEQVYISKITPLDAARVEEQQRRAEAERVSKSSAAALARATVGESKQDQGKPSTPSTDSKAPSEEKNKPVKANSEPKALVKQTEQSNKPDTKPEKKPEPKSDERENALAAALAAESGGSNVDVGWVVQVGVFTDKKGAEKVVKDLRTKGFKPSTSIVDTNRGKATGTRVWLGPFAQRVDAAKTKTRLTDRTGEPGFIRAYP